MGRSPCCDKTKVKKGPWSHEEDALLINFFKKYGNGGNWISLPKRAGLNRCGKSCRLRWLNYLRPNIKHGDFTEEEDYMIYSLYISIGSRWSIIASHLQGRTDNDVKNYWNTNLNRKISSGKFKNDIPISNTKTYYNYGISSNYYTNTKYSTLSLQTLGHENIMSSELDNYHFLHDQRQCDSINMKEGIVKNTQSYSSSSSMTPGISSYSGSSSNSLDSNQYSSDSTAIRGEEDEIWMDLLSDSFEDVVGGSQLEEKINEIASLLDDSFSS